MDKELIESVRAIVRGGAEAAKQTIERHWFEARAGPRPNSDRVWIGSNAPDGFVDEGAVEVCVRCARIQVGDDAILLPVELVEVVQWPHTKYNDPFDLELQDLKTSIQTALAAVGTWLHGVVIPNCGLDFKKRSLTIHGSFVTIDEVDDGRGDSFVVAVDCFIR